MRRSHALVVCLLGWVMACSGSPSAPADAGRGDTGDSALDLGVPADVPSLDVVDAGDVASPGDSGSPGDRGPTEEMRPSCVDSDGDGYPATECGGMAPDCDDTNNRVNPGRSEVCDTAGVDEDCNPCTVASATTRDGDADMDGFLSARCTNPFAGTAPTCDPMVVTVNATARTVSGRDCNDDRAMGGADVRPNQVEVCGNMVDDNCDGRVDYADALYEDRDNDGRGNRAVMMPGMCRPGWVANSEDCDDARSETYRGARELCDGRDNDCGQPGAMAGGTEPGEDGDGDGHAPLSESCLGRGEPGAPGFALPRDDCNDAAATVYTGATEVCGNGVDEDCNRVVDDPTRTVCTDADGDGHGTAATMRTVMSCTLPAGTVTVCDDCDDTSAVAARRTPGAREVCDRVDNDCSTPGSPVAIDEDQDDDGYASSGAGCAGRGEAGVPTTAFPKTDCNDTNREVRPGAVEICDRNDSDCSSGGGVALDEDADNDGHSPTAATCRGRGESDAPITAFPKDDCDDTHPTVHGGRTAADDTSTCDGLDNDCNPATSELMRTEDCASPGYCIPGGLCGQNVTLLQMVASLHTCARLGDGSVRCWGYNSRGQLGDGTMTNRPNPTLVPGLTGVIELAAGYHTCARLGDGSVRCWGNNQWGQLGDGTTTNRPNPTLVPGLTGVIELTPGNVHTCARLGDGSVRCWGNNQWGQLGDGTTTNRPNPTLVPGLTGVVELAAVGSHTCARLGDGSVRCWGNNSYGQLGDGTTTNRPNPTLVPGLTGVVELAAGNYHTCARLGDGSVRCWGNNSYGQLGDGTTTNRPSPTLVPGLTGVIELTPGNVHTCARLGDDSVRCWGNNPYGQLGDGTTTNRPSPTLVPKQDLRSSFPPCAVA